jgi:hypothetical protein
MFSRATRLLALHVALLSADAPSFSNAFQQFRMLRKHVATDSVPSLIRALNFQIGPHRMSNDDTTEIPVGTGTAESHSISTTGTCSTGSTWSVTDNWNRLSQSDNINYNYGEDDGGDISTRVLNSIDQVTIAALRMQNFGMATNSLGPPMTSEEIWIQKSIQQIVTDDESNHDNRNEGTGPNHPIGTLNTEQFLEDMGNDIAKLIRCNENKNDSTASISNNNNDHTSSLFMDECEIVDDFAPSDSASATTDKQGKSSYERVDVHNGVPIWMKDGEFGT